MTNTTIVSAFIYSNKNKHRDIENYKIYGEALINEEKLKMMPKIIFLDSLLFGYFDEKFSGSENLLLIETNLEDLYLQKYDIPCKINTDNPQKDNFNYFTIICNKTEWMREAITINHFNTENFVWIDFGIKHCVGNGALWNNFSKTFEKIRIASIWNLTITYNIDIYKDVAWYFAGGVFGGDKYNLLLFADLMKQKCIDLIENSQTLMWEVNIWYLIYLENPVIFDPYFGNHDKTIINNF